MSPGGYGFPSRGTGHEGHSEEIMMKAVDAVICAVCLFSCGPDKTERVQLRRTSAHTHICASVQFDLVAVVASLSL